MNKFRDTIPVMTKDEAEEGIAATWHLHRVHAPHDYRIHTAEVADDAANDDDDPQAGAGAVVVPLVLLAAIGAAFALIVRGLP
jgi:hypothetical protein